MSVLLGDSENHYRVNHRGDLVGEVGHELYSPNETQVRSARLRATEPRRREKYSPEFRVSVYIVVLAAIFGLYLLVRAM